MPIRRELRPLYPAHWPELSRRVRFERAGGACERCGRPHGLALRCLPDGRWFDPEAVHLARQPRPAGALARPRGDDPPIHDPRHPGRGACEP